MQDTIQVKEIDGYDTSTLRVFATMGAPVPRALVKQAKEKLRCQVLSGWRQTENGLVTLSKLNDSEDKIVNTDGKPFPGMELKVVDLEGQSAQPNTEGDLLCRGPALFVGYLKRMEKTKEEFKDGWFKTGDRATIDEDGYIRITGRSKDIIIRGG